MIMAKISFYRLLGLCVRKHGRDHAPKESTASPGMEMSELYVKIIRLMENEKPYLRPQYSLDDMAMDIGTNRLFVSRVVNMYSGKNFKQFINFYRISCAVDMLKENPHIRITELSGLCGFYTPVSFNMAFKRFMAQTPTEYAQTIRLPGYPKSESAALRPASAPVEKADCKLYPPVSQSQSKTSPAK